MVDTPIKPELSPTEVAVLEKARKSSTRRGVHVFGDEADVARELMSEQPPKSWGGPHHGPRWGPGPWVTGYPDGNDIVLGGLTAAGLMVLDDWLNRRNEPVEPQGPGDDEGAP